MGHGLSDHEVWWLGTPEKQESDKQMCCSCQACIFCLGMAGKLAVSDEARHVTSLLSEDGEPRVVVYMDDNTN